MKFKVLYSLILIFSATLNAFSQKFIIINGTVKDSLNNNVPDVIVVASTNQKQYFASTNFDGYFSFSIPISSNQLVSIVFKNVNYEEKKIIIETDSNEVNTGVIYVKYKETYLSEVIVENKAIIKRGDTTIFNVGSFKNKLDANLEDVLKKMPGMDVDEAGNIKYNNKAIENIMIEGDVLSKNYKLISKNITPDMIDKVEIIDKYNNNPALKDLTSSQKQIMNLVLKNPKKLRTFGNIKIGAGIENKVNVGGNMFVINSKIKSMIIANHNNTGQSPYSEFSVDQQFSKTKEYEFDQTIIPNYITENNLFLQSFLGTNKNSLFNNSNLGVINNSYRINKKLVFKLFTDIYGDNVKQYQQTIIKNNLFPNLSYNENIEKRFRPINFNNNFEVKYNTEKSQFLFGVTYISKKYSEYNSLNSLTNFETNLTSEYKRVAIGAYYTHRIDSIKAFEIYIQYNKDNKSQFFDIEQSKYRLLDTSIFTNFQTQATSNNISYLTGEFKYFFKNKQANELSLKSTLFDSKLNADLRLTDIFNNNLIVPNFINKTNIVNNDLLLNYKTSFGLGKINCTADVGILLNTNNGKQFLNTTVNNSLFPVPKVRFSYSINGKQEISANIGLDVAYPNLTNTHINALLFSYRSSKVNAALPKAVKSLKYGFDYSYSDFNKASFFVLSFIHSSQFLSEIRSYNFTKDFDYSTIRYEKVPQKFNNIYTKFDKYMYSINTGLSLKNSVLIFSNPIEVASNIVSSNFLVYNSSLTVRPKFNKNINSSLGLDYILNKDLESDFSSFQLNPFFDLTGSISKKFSLGTRLNYFYTDYSVKKLSYVFANMYTFFTIKPQKIEAKFSIVNVFNTNGFLSGNVSSAISKSINTAILPRFATLEFTYKF